METKELTHLEDLNLQGLIKISSFGTTCSFFSYDDGDTVEVFEDKENLNKICQRLDDENFNYEIEFFDNDGIETDDEDEEWVLTIKK